MVWDDVPSGQCRASAVWAAEGEALGPCTCLSSRQLCGQTGLRAFLGSALCLPSHPVLTQLCPSHLSPGGILCCSLPMLTCKELVSKELMIYPGGCSGLEDEPPLPPAQQPWPRHHYNTAGPPALQADSSGAAVLAAKKGFCRGSSHSKAPFIFKSKCGSGPSAIALCHPHILRPGKEVTS